MILTAAGVLGRVPQVGPLVLVTACATGAALYLRHAPTRRSLDALPLRALVAVHAIRLPIGALFLVEASHGRLAPLFATRAGYGDIAIGALAIVVACVPRRGLVRAFSLVGLVDIFVALGTGMYLMFAAQDPLMLAAIARAPYPMLPFFVVPAVILTHLLVLARTRRTAAR